MKKTDHTSYFASRKSLLPFFSMVHFGFIAALLLLSCEKKETPVPPIVPGNINKVVISIGYPYNNQVYYKADGNKIVSTNLKYVWDLSFACNDSLFDIRLNTARGMLAANTMSANFDSVFTTANLTWRWDNSNGEPGKTAMYDWYYTNNNTLVLSYYVFIIDMQFDANGNHLGYKKFSVIAYANGIYQIRFANLDGSNDFIYEVEKNKNYNQVFFSFSSGVQTVNIEPESKNWDLLFSNYQHKFEELDLPFVITGCMINRYAGVMAAKDSTLNFYNITLDDTSKFIFSNQADKIGYDWKIRNSTDNSFTIEPRYFYIIRSVSGLYYKIKFVDFYNEQGEKGYPTFEIQKL